MTLGIPGHRGGVESSHDPVRPAPPSPVDEAFADIVADLRAGDRRFARRVRHPADRRVGTLNLAIVVAALATVLLGVVPLAVGVHTGVLALLIVGAVSCVVLPVAIPACARFLAP